MFKIQKILHADYIAFMRFVWLSKQDYFPVQHWLVCITETECVYCAVRTGSLYIVLSSAQIYAFCVDVRTNSDYFPIQH